MVQHLPEFLDPLFNILDDPCPEISTLCDNLLGEFLSHIIDKPEVRDFSSWKSGCWNCPFQVVDFPGMINILISHSQSSTVGLQMMAITWIREFVNLSGSEMLPFTSGILTCKH